MRIQFFLVLFGLCLVACAHKMRLTSSYGPTSEYDQGYKYGLKAGKNDGYSVGYNDARKACGDDVMPMVGRTSPPIGKSGGYQRGYNSAYDEGKKAGYDKGYREGSADCGSTKGTSLGSSRH